MCLCVLTSSGTTPWSRWPDFRLGSLRNGGKGFVTSNKHCKYYHVRLSYLKSRSPSVNMEHVMNCTAASQQGAIAMFCLCLTTYIVIFGTYSPNSRWLLCLDCLYFPQRWPASAFKMETLFAFLSNTLKRVVKLQRHSCRLHSIYLASHSSPRRAQSRKTGSH